jgi:AcrR family transcriptional regulator
MVCPTSAKPSRRHAKQARSQETLRIVLEAAAQVLVREGYARATTNRIAEVAGVSVGTIYQYFANKDVLFDALIQRYFNEILEQIRGLSLDLSRPFEMTLRAVISNGIRAQRYGPELLHALEYVPNAIFRRRLHEGKQQLIAFVGTLLEAYRGDLRAIDLNRAATLIVNAAEGIGYNASVETFDEQLADELTTLFARYLLDSSQLDRDRSVDTPIHTPSSKRGRSR